MNWYRELSLLEISFIGGFLFLYLLYLLRVRHLARFFHVSPYRVWFKLLLRTLYMGLLVVALLGPAFGDMKKEIKSIGLDIYVAVDLSRSMDATDVQPSRLEKARQVLRQLIDELHSDRLGIIIFAGEAFVQSPLTYDQGALHLFTETLQTNLISGGGTDLGMALKLAKGRLQEDNTARSQRAAKIIVVLSDGEDFGEKAAKEAAELKRGNVKLLTVGIGTEQGGRIPEGTGFKRDREGKVIETRLNSESLRELAREAGGSYFEVNATLNETTRLVSAIKEVEGTVRATRSVDVSANKYFYPLLAALLLLFLDVLITVKVIRI